MSIERSIRSCIVLSRLSAIRDGYVKHLANPDVGFELLDASEFDEIYEFFPDLANFVDLPADDPAFQRMFLEHLVRVIGDALKVLGKSSLQ